MAIAPQKIVSLPAPEDADHSLLATAINPGGDGRPDDWQRGLTAKAEFCGEASAWDPCGSVGDRAKSTPGENPDTFDYQPFVLEAPIQCSSAGWEAADYEGKALRFIQAATAKALEREFWTGEKIPSNMSLQGGTPNDDDHVLNPGGWMAPEAVSASSALILLSSALANCGVGAKGMIHAPASIAESWYASYSLDEDDDGNLVTGARGDVVVVGSGYTGQGPYGQPDPDEGQAWVYATGPVTVLLDDAEVFPKSLAEALDRQTNTVVFRGERTAAAFHNGCCSFAVLVDLDITAVPLVNCPPAEPIARSYTVKGNWVENFPGGGSALVIGVPDGISPAPTSLSAEISFAPPRAVPPVGVPTAADLPSSWFEMGAGADPTVYLPLDFLPPEAANGVWVREKVTDETGCFTVVYLFIPVIPASWEDDVQTYIAVSDLVFTGTVIPGGTEDPTTMLDVVDDLGICPTPATAVPVSQACGEVWQVEGDITVELGVTPVDCEGTLSLPVVVCPPAGQALSVQGAQLTAAPGGSDNDIVPAGARVVVFRWYGGTLQDNTGGSSPKDNTCATIQNGIGNLTMSPTDPPLTMTAPDGFLFPAIPVQVIANSGESVNALFSWLAYY